MGPESMTTRERLETMTDSAKFEELAAAVLWHTNEAYRHIVEVGLGRKGKAVNAPVDGFCKVPGTDPPHFLFVQYTTTDMRSLRGKWLDTSDGDLPKAGKEAHDFLEHYPDARFTVVLATNQKLSGKTGLRLLKDTHVRAKKLGIECDPLEQSEIARFLDTTSVGHYLRKEYLGIGAVLLSEELLRDLCAKSIKEFREFISHDPDTTVLREIASVIEEELRSRPGIVVLEGESGFGKSVVALEAAQHHHAKGGLALWIRDDVAERAMSMDEAIRKMLLKLSPGLQPDADVGRCLGTTHLLVIADDVNRATDPERLFGKLVSWSRNKGEEDRASCTIVCPLWPRVWGAGGHSLKDQDIRVVHIDVLTQREGEAGVRKAASKAGVTLTAAKASEFADQLSNDPFLIGLCGRLLQEGHELSGQDISKQFLRQEVDRLARTSASQLQRV